MLERASAVAAAVGLFAACTAVYIPLLVIASRLGLTERYQSGDRGPLWIGLTVGHIAQAAVCVAIITLVMRSPLSEWGLNTHNWQSSLRWIGWFCLAWIPVVGIVNVFIPLLRRVPPSFALPQRAVDVVGWLAFEFLIVGVTEEMVFRGLVQTYLARTFSGTIGPIPTAGIVSTLVFCVAHFYPRIHWPQQVFAAGLGLVYATVYHRTGSLAAPIAIHSISDGTVVAAMWMVRAWYDALKSEPHAPRSTHAFSAFSSSTNRPSTGSETSPSKSSRSRCSTRSRTSCRPRTRPLRRTRRRRCSNIAGLLGVARVF